MENCVRCVDPLDYSLRPSRFFVFRIIHYIMNNKQRYKKARALWTSYQISMRCVSCIRDQYTFWIQPAAPPFVPLLISPFRICEKGVWIWFVGGGRGRGRLFQIREREREKTDTNKAHEFGSCVLSTKALFFDVCLLCERTKRRGILLFCSDSVVRIGVFWESGRSPLS